MSNVSQTNASPVAQLEGKNIHICPSSRAARPCLAALVGLALLASSAAILFCALYPDLQLSEITRGALIVGGITAGLTGIVVATTALLIYCAGQTNPSYNICHCSSAEHQEEHDQITKNIETMREENKILKTTLKAAEEKFIEDMQHTHKTLAKKIQESIDNHANDNHSSMREIENIAQKAINTAMAHHNASHLTLDDVKNIVSTQQQSPLLMNEAIRKAIKQHEEATHNIAEQRMSALENQVVRHVSNTDIHHTHQHQHGGIQLPMYNYNALNR